MPNPPKPAALKLLDTRGKRRKTNPPQPSDERPPTCPSWLSGPARMEWKRVSRTLKTLPGLVTKLDRAMLARYCTCYGRWQEAEKQIAKTGGDVIATTAGNLIQNPWLAVANRAQQELERSAKELGLTPVSRARIHVAPRKGASMKARLVKRIAERERASECSSSGIEEGEKAQR